MAPETLNFVGFLASSTGQFVGILGTLLMANAYHPFAVWHFLSRSAPAAGWRFLRGGSGAVRKYLSTAVKLAEINPEDRPLSLAGLCLIFFGFVLQFFGRSDPGRGAVH
jgi:hypothetical protein